MQKGTRIGWRGLSATVRFLLSLTRKLWQGGASSKRLNLILAGGPRLSSEPREKKRVVPSVGRDRPVAYAASLSRHSPARST
jgi:hypothetical protein